MSKSAPAPPQSSPVVGIFLVTLVILAIPGLAACSPVEISPDAPLASPSPGITPAAHWPDPDLVITPAQSGQLIGVVRGQIIGIANPSSSVEWQVDFAASALELLTPSEQVRAPGPEGWRFRALAPGQTDLVLTSISPPCSDSTPCPPMPARFVFTIEVK